MSKVLATPFKTVSYTQCSCGMPGCAIRVATDHDGIVWLSMQSRGRGLLERIKVAWRALMGRDTVWCETVLDLEQYSTLYQYVMVGAPRTPPTTGEE